MSRAARHRQRPNRGRLQPYAWLGAGALTVGLGAAMLGGTAVASAETGPDDAASTSDTAQTAAPARQTAGPAKKSANRGGRGAAVDTGQPAPAAAAAAAERAESALPAPAATADRAATTIAPAGRGSAARTARAAAVATSPAVEASSPAPQPVEAAPAAPDLSAPAASVPGPAADPAPNMESWLPSTPIVPGVKVALSLQQIDQAQAVLQAQTWGSGNILAGLAAIGPQILLAGASLSLGAWQSNIDGAQQFLASTAGIPIIQQIAQTNLLVTTWLPPIAQTSMDVAQFLLPVVGLFGAPAAVAATQPLIAAAHQNGFVYAVVPLQVKLGTQPVAGVSINGGGRVPLLVDTGASGVVVLPGAVPNVGSLTPVGAGDSCFSGGLCYHYETYEVPVDFGGGAVTSTGLVNVVTNNDEYPESVATFEEYFSWGADGIMGIGANTAGPGPAPIANATLPGELNTGVLLFQGLLPFGLGGLMVFGANPLPTRVSLPGAPDAYIKISVNGGTPITAQSPAIIDSGGVYGTILRSDLPAGLAGVDDLPAGTRITGYAPDGVTQLYTFTTLSGDRATPVIDVGLMNTGNAPFAQNPIYMNYAGPGSGIGSTDFSIW